MKNLTNLVFPAKDRSCLPIALRKRIPYLVWVDILLIPYFILSAMIRYAQDPERARLFALLVFITTLLYIPSLVCIRRRKYDAASLLNSAATFLNTFYVAAFLPIPSAANIYTAGFFLVSSIITNKLVAIRKRQTEVFGALSILTIVFVGSALYVPRFGAAAWPPLLIAFILLVTIIFIVDLDKRYSAFLVGYADSESIANLAKLEEIKKILANSQSAFKLGDQLRRETDESRESIRAIKDSLDALAQDAARLADNASTSERMNREIVDYTGAMKRSVLDQNANLTETSSAITQIINTIKTIGLAANEKYGSLKELSSQLEAFREDISTTRESMGRIRASSAKSLESIASIKDISERTGLLAMNASIEAAHAGAFGKGFSVIAQEVRKLSETAQASSEQITDALGRNEKVVHEASDKIDVFTKRVDGMAGGLKGVMMSLEGVLQGLREVSEGSDELAAATSHMIGNAQETEGGVNGVYERIETGSATTSEISVFSRGLSEKVDILVKNLKNVESVTDRIASACGENSQTIGYLRDEIERAGRNQPDVPA